MNNATTNAAILGVQAGAVALTTSQTYTFVGAGRVQVWLIGGGGAGASGHAGGGGSGILVKLSAFDVSVGSTLNVVVGSGGSDGGNGGATTVSGSVSASAAGGTGAGQPGGAGGSGGGGNGNSGCGGAGGTNGGNGVTGCTNIGGAGQGLWTSMLSVLGENPYGIQAGAGGSEGNKCPLPSPCCSHCSGGGGGGLYFGVESPVGGYVTVSNPSVSTSAFQATPGQGFGAGGAGGGYKEGVYAPHTDGADGLVYMMFMS